MIAFGMLQPHPQPSVVDHPQERRQLGSPRRRRISEVADAVGLSTHALRYYERAGLIDPVDRAESGHRRFTDDDLDWIGFVTRLRATGMPIRELQEFAALRRDDQASTEREIEVLEGHRAHVIQRIRELGANLDIIDEAIAERRTLLGESGGPARVHHMRPRADGRAPR
jgi:DNA-binding transcriptional MerR regulator